MKFPALSVCFVAMAVAVAAQETKVAIIPKTDLQIAQEAVALRADLTARVAAGEMRPTVAFEQVRAAHAPSGLKLEAKADFALAALDIGQRLIVVGKPAEAEEFFRAAEQTLNQILEQTPDTRAREKAMYLQHRALLRGNYLNKVEEARSDLKQAIYLVPEDKHLKIAAAALERVRPEHINDRIKP